MIFYSIKKKSINEKLKVTKKKANSILKKLKYIKNLSLMIDEPLGRSNYFKLW